MNVYPSNEFWESDLEVPVNLLLERFQDSNVRQSWLDSLSGKQLSIIFQHCFKNHLNGQLFQDGNYDDRSTQQKRKILTSYSDSLFDYYLISYFDRTKLEATVSEVARFALTEKLMRSYLVKNNTKYDKRSLLFLLFHINCELLKSVYHFDKVQKKGFVSFALQKSPRQIHTSFKEFMSREAVEQILKDDDQLQGFFHHQDRIYMFVRRGSDMDLLLNSNKVVHGHKPEWMILDFSLDGTQVNLCAKNTNKAVEIANSIVSGYFDCECTFVSIQDKNFPLQVHKFLQACIDGSDSDICIFELNFKSDYFKNSNTYLTLSVKPYDPIAPELHILKPAIGNILQSIQSAKVMFQNKKVTFSFKISGEVYYSEHPLNKKEREDLKKHMEQSYGLKILSRANC
ncbi:hypothetical protein [Wolbachia endosymbiont (group B) of Longitarsus flavicornis]|uniref:hypothetical protein n=1 Tax=Wolbachia endosymbiont (group B) of Longitarsus flavicornis TaxID=3066135 RepID=UPI003341CF16